MIRRAASLNDNPIFTKVCKRMGRDVKGLNAAKAVNPH